VPALLHHPSSPSTAGGPRPPAPGVLGSHLGSGTPFALDRAAADAAQQVADLVRQLATAWPAPAAAPVRTTWRALAALGRADLAVGRLVEGHVDALWILHEGGREPVPGAVYGVWASASGGTGLTAVANGHTGGTGWSVNGTMRYCSGAGFVDRALVVVSAPDGKRLVDLDVRAAQAPGGSLIRDDDSWPAVGMDVTGSVDIAVRDLGVSAGDAVGGPGFYLDRPGFAAGGVGVAAVWLGGAAGVLDDLVRTLAPGRASAHQLAHLGALAATLTTADALLAELAERIDATDPAGRSLPAGDAGAARSAVELAVEDVLHRAPRVSGPTPLCRDARFAHRLADLAVYVRQHHAEADYEHLGRELLASGELLGRRFG
jgi:alkylation response protein AidB-like acyl-CoA dehydrogenase